MAHFIGIGAVDGGGRHNGEGGNTGAESIVPESSAGNCFRDSGSPQTRQFVPLYRCYSHIHRCLQSSCSDGPEVVRALPEGRFSSSEVAFFPPEGTFRHPEAMFYAREGTFRKPEGGFSTQKELSAPRKSHLGAEKSCATPRKLRELTAKSRTTAQKLRATNRNPAPTARHLHKATPDLLALGSDIAAIANDPSRLINANRVPAAHFFRSRSEMKIAPRIKGCGWRQVSWSARRKLRLTPRTSED